MRKRTLFACLLAAGCLSPAAPTPVRTFEPAPASYPTATRDDVRPLLVVVEGRELLGERMVWRLSAVEAFRDEENRWSADPATLVREALESALFVGGGYAPSEARETPELHVRLTHFEGDLEGPPRARVALVATLRGPGPGPGAAATRRFEASTPLPGPDPASAGGADLATSIGAALQSVVSELQDWLETRT